MSWYELWLFLHIAAVIVWIGGAATIQVFGILTKRAADPAKTAFFAQSVSFTSCGSSCLRRSWCSRRESA